MKYDKDASTLVAVGKVGSSQDSEESQEVRWCRKSLRSQCRVAHPVQISKGRAN